MWVIDVHTEVAFVLCRRAQDMDYELRALTFEPRCPAEVNSHERWL